MNVQIEARLAEFIEQQVRAGRYRSADAMVNAAAARLHAEQELQPG